MGGARFSESVVEEAALGWLEALGYSVAHGPDISPGGDTLTLTLDVSPAFSIEKLYKSSRSM